MSQNNISFVIPSFNESENILELYKRIKKTLNRINISDYEIIYVENGSTDNSLEILRELNKQDKLVKAISFTRNFGLSNALFAGLKYSTKEFICILDGDLQDPPELVEDFFIKINQGYEIVYGIRKKRDTGFLKKAAYKIFYNVFALLSEVKMPKNVGEFCLIKRKVADVLLSMNENNIFIRGLRTWTGFKQTGIEYSRPDRFAGKVKFNFLNSFFLGLDGIISFSLIPLRIILILSIILLFLSVFYLLFILSTKFFAILGIINSDAALLMPKGLTATNIILGTYLSFMFFSLGLIGEYIGKIYLEVKKRPKYIIKELI